jgi:membrane protein EpsK
MLWMTPFLLQRVGLQAYGLLQLAIQVSAYAGIVFVALNGSERRFVPMLVQNGRASEAAGVLRTTVTLNLALAALLKVESKGSPQVVMRGINIALLPGKRICVGSVPG